MSTIKTSARFKLRSIFLILATAILIIPIGAILSFRLFENELVIKTERSLISQAAILAAITRQELQPTNQNLGILLKHVPATDEYYTPIDTQIDLSKNKILPPRPNGNPSKRKADPAFELAQNKLSTIAEETKRVTLSSIRIVDFQGIVIAGTNEIGLDLSGIEEVDSALKGHYTSVIRQRISDSPKPALESMSRGSNIRVFIAYPIIDNNRLLGAIYLSRTPKSILKQLYSQKEKLIAIGLLLLCLTLLISWLISFTISTPIHTLIRHVKSVVTGENQSLPKLKHPGTVEVDLLAQHFATMTEALRLRSDYIKQFAIHISHEFKTPLTAIQGATELLQEHIDSMSKEQRSRFLHNIEEDSERLQRLVARLLDLAKADSVIFTQQDCNPEPIIQRLVSRYQSLGLNIHTENQFHGNLSIAEDLFESILINLLDNSRQHQATTVAITLYSEKNMAAISLSDNGQGVSENNRDKIFTPFFTTKRDHGGTGLGLEIVRSLLETHHGNITLANADNGACFVIRLPISIE